MAQEDLNSYLLQVAVILYNRIVMEVKTVIQELKKRHPKGVIIENKNAKGITTEIICELDSTKDRSFAIAVIDSSTIHYHRKMTETYKVLKGSLRVFKYDSEKRRYAEHYVEKGKSIIIRPGEIHSNIGDETWIEVISEPAWTIDDYINLDTILKKYMGKDS